MDSKDQRPPSEVRLGSVLVSLLEPDRGREVEFNRWYERDHFYAGCMAGPHFFSGRRFVATHDLKKVRLPEDASLFRDVGDGSYLSLYWILAGHHEEAERWAVDRVQSLIAHDRMMSGRRPVHAGFYQHRFTVAADSDGVPAELALEHPFGGVGLTIIDAANRARLDELATRLEREWLPESIHRFGAALMLGSTPTPLPDDAPDYVERSPDLDRRILLLSFFANDPGRALRAWTGELAAHVEGAHLGQLRISGAFIPTIPGTDRYADELWRRAPEPDAS